MTKSEMFKAAHKLAKTFVGDYRACFAMALKIVRECPKQNTKKTKKTKITVLTNGYDNTRKSLNLLGRLEFQNGFNFKNYKGQDVFVQSIPFFYYKVRFSIDGLEDTTKIFNFIKDARAFILNQIQG